MIAEDTMTQCPQCEADLARFMTDDEGIDFCPKCQLPLMLIAGKYRLTGILGEGGFGKVYHAKHVSLRRDAERVIKVIKSEIIKQPEMRERFMREVQMTSVLSQENQHIVRVYDDFGEVPRLGTFYVMEYLKGRTLTEYIADPKDLPDIGWSLHVFEQLCDAMQAAHENGVIHRDLKPDNLLLIQKRKRPNFLKVLDFGIAKTLDDGASKQLTQGVLGTPFYLAPEQAINQGVDQRTDVYAMGTILFEMLTGQLPWIRPEHMNSISALELISLKMNAQTPPSAGNTRPDRNIPEPISEAIQKAIHFDLNERYQNADAFWEELAKHAHLVGADISKSPRHTPVIHTHNTPSHALAETYSADSLEANAVSGTHTPAPLPTGRMLLEDIPPQDSSPSLDSVPAPSPGPLPTASGATLTPSQPKQREAKKRSPVGLILLTLLLLAIGSGGIMVSQGMFSRATDTDPTPPQRAVTPTPEPKRIAAKRIAAKRAVTPTPEPRRPTPKVDKRPVARPVKRRRLRRRRIKRRRRRKRRVVARAVVRVAPRPAPAPVVPDKPPKPAAPPPICKPNETLLVVRPYSSSLSILFGSGKGKARRLKKGICVPSNTKQVGISLRNYDDCFFSIRGRKKLRINLQEAGKSVPGESSCVR